MNILGLTIGLTTSFLILLYVQHESSYDRFHKDANRIHRVTMSFKNGDAYTTTTTSPYKVAPMLEEHFPTIESTLRLFYTFNDRSEIIYNSQSTEITDWFTFTDPNLFSFFSFKLLYGDEESALTKPNSIVITQSEAKKLFRDKDPTGQLVTFRNIYDGTQTNLTVTGIMEDMPVNSHIPYRYYISMKTKENLSRGMTTSWGWTSQNNYFKLKEGADIAAIKNRLTDVVKLSTPEWFQNWAYLDTQPLLDIHLHSNLKEEIRPGGNVTYVQMLSTIAFFVLLIAAINYMNISTSLASSRMKEIGIKKIVGADRRHLVMQFLFESFLLLIVALMTSIALIQFILPDFSQLVGRQLYIDNIPLIYFGYATLIVLVLGLISGSYPALFLSSFKIVSALSVDRYRFGKKAAAFRTGLVILQFVISSFLICSTLVILNQWDYLKNRALGLDTEQIISITLPSRSAQGNYEIFRNGIIGQSDVLEVGTCSKEMTGWYDNFGIFSYQGLEYSVPIERADKHFFEAVKIELVAGHYFQGSPADSNAIVLNEKALIQLGINDPIGEVINANDKEYKIIGVVKDFHFEPLYTELGPIVFFKAVSGANYVYAKLNMSNIGETISGIEEVWNELNPGRIMDYSFVDSEIERAYQSEKQFFGVFTLFSALAILIACLGLYGLVTFSVSLKIKEIGIRKVFGASTKSILALLSERFFILILISNLLSWPLSFYAMSRWLQKFPYRVDFSLTILIIGTLISLGISLFVIGARSLRASSLNPVSALRCD
ncbi:ABC transporter permease [Fulvivirga sp. M361]|uniref:ABC transporter permease n=1 Tax=Fulvivirga sp. M361 TaxID=2594266 RepID=UPI0016290981|nr:ABC transporter permease [Fulvivirga sp. M361]